MRKPNAKTLVLIFPAIILLIITSSFALADSSELTQEDILYGEIHLPCVEEYQSCQDIEFFECGRPFDSESCRKSREEYGYDNPTTFRRQATACAASKLATQAKIEPGSIKNDAPRQIERQKLCKCMIDKCAAEAEKFRKYVYDEIKVKPKSKYADSDYPFNIETSLLDVPTRSRTLEKIEVAQTTIVFEIRNKAGKKVYEDEVKLKVKGAIAPGEVYLDYSHDVLGKETYNPVSKTVKTSWNGHMLLSGKTVLANQKEATAKAKEGTTLSLQTEPGEYTVTAKVFKDNTLVQETKPTKLTIIPKYEPKCPEEIELSPSYSLILPINPDEIKENMLNKEYVVSESLKAEINDPYAEQKAVIIKAKCSDPTIDKFTIEITKDGKKIKEFKIPEPIATPTPTPKEEKNQLKKITDALINAPSIFSREPQITRTQDAFNAKWTISPENQNILGEYTITAYQTEKPGKKASKKFSIQERQTQQACTPSALLFNFKVFEEFRTEYERQLDKQTSTAQGKKAFDEYQASFEKERKTGKLPTALKNMLEKQVSPTEEDIDKATFKKYSGFEHVYTEQISNKIEQGTPALFDETLKGCKQTAESELKWCISNSKSELQDATDKLLNDYLAKERKKIEATVEKDKFEDLPKNARTDEKFEMLRTALRQSKIEEATSKIKKEAEISSFPLQNCIASQVERLCRKKSEYTLVGCVSYLVRKNKNAPEGQGVLNVDETNTPLIKNVDDLDKRLDDIFKTEELPEIERIKGEKAEVKPPTKRRNGVFNFLVDILPIPSVVKRVIKTTAGMIR